MILEQTPKEEEELLQPTQLIYSRDRSQSPCPSATRGNGSQALWDQLPDYTSLYSHYDSQVVFRSPERAPNLKAATERSITTDSRASSSTLLDTPITPSSLGRKRSFEATGIPPASPIPKKRKSNIHDTPKHCATPGKYKLSESVGTNPEKIIKEKYPELLDHNPVVIAHSDDYQTLFNSRGICFGVQLEIARLISSERIQWEQISIPAVKDLEGGNKAAAPRVEERLLSREMSATYKEQFADELTAKTPWSELDLEEADTKDVKIRRSMGCHASDPWYGGKVDVCGKLKVDQQGHYKVVIDQARLASSTRFKRIWGSKSFLFIKIPSHIRKRTKNQLLNFFQRPFILMGRVYRAFMLSDDTVHLFAASDNFLFDSPDGLSDINRFWAFINLHNPISMNCNQGSAKYGSRFKLSSSNSVPGVRIALEDVIRIEDIVAEGYNHVRGQKLPAEYDMTDGCGFINREGMKRIRGQLQLDHMPSAIQCRILGAKGMLLLKDEEDKGYDTTKPRVYLRPSQIKIEFDEAELRKRHVPIVDIIRFSRHKMAANLSPDTMVNLAENGVPHTAFCKLMIDGLQASVEALTEYKDKTSMLFLWRAVQKAGNVISQRIARELGGASRARGFGDRQEDEQEDEDEDAEEEDEKGYLGKSSAWWVDMISGCPSSLEETVMTMLDSGFNPNLNEILFDKLEKVIKTVMNRYVARYKLEVPMSTTAFMIPDPEGVLASDEVFFQSSEPFVGADGCEDSFLRGDVLVTRHPCRLPTDVQKVKAVFQSSLCPYRDVIIFSIKGSRSPASMLGGGDYDGDTAQLIWQPEIVEPFRNADPKYATAPKEIAADTKKEDRPLRSFTDRKLSPEECVKELTPYLLAGLKDTSLVGIYSNWHIMATYRNGYAHEDTIRLAWMFCTILDGSKTGLTVTEQRYKQDKEFWNWRRMPIWKEESEDKMIKGEKTEVQKVHNTNPIQREMEVRGKKFVMDDLSATGKKEVKKCLAKLSEGKKHVRGVYDHDLSRPWKEVQEMAERQAAAGFPYFRDIIIPGIETHVEKIRAEHRLAVMQNFTQKPIQERQDILRSLSLKFLRYTNNPPEGCKLRDYLSKEAALTACVSYAYIHDFAAQKNNSTRFPYDIGMRELCAIKARACGHPKTVCGLFYNHMNVRAHNTLS